jgi:hypothetical protein
MRKLLLISLFIPLFVLTSEARKEKITFNLKFGFIKGGEAHIVITDTVFNNQRALHYYLVGRTTGLSDRLFGVNDIYETTVAYDTRLPLKSIRNIREGKYTWYNETYFYHNKGTLNSKKSGWKEMPENLVDIISVFFYFIKHYVTDGMQQGLEVTFPTYHGDEINDVTVRYMGDQIIDTGNGKVDCYILAPSVDKGKVLKRSDGLRFWISKETKLPILLEFDMRVGALRAEMQSYTVDGKEQAFK